MIATGKPLNLGGDMLICDRTWKRDGQPKDAKVTIVFAGPELEEEYHLCVSEAELVRSFINEPSQWTRPPKGKVRDILSLKDKTKRKAKSPGNNSAA